MNSLTLPDMATQTLEQQQPLDWVGMADIALPVRLHGQSIAARAQPASVSMTARRAAFICRACTWRCRRWSRPS
jgi:GTP cyclohydrolase FolE2